MIGRVHSEESFGTVDGPGVRYVLFLQGCPMRCRYCHNPDTWGQGGKEMTVEQVLGKYEKNKAFYTKGGITVTGGEPLMQMAFVTELFTEAKGRGIHTCLDTSGITFDSARKAEFDKLMAVTDLVMLDIKHIRSEAHIALTGHDNKNVLAFARYLADKNIPLWVRHVVVPGVTDDPDDLRELGKFIGALPNVKALDCIPYHTMGVAKYEAMGLEYSLKDTPALTKEAAETARNHILTGIRIYRYK
ncbi:MAG: pyruvate formate lyase-activating protein [Clostridia bacterium]|nr:pyruvate formate lyase-activating protein [Clostridia bacterium]